MKETVWLYPGSFDPLTYGHIDIIGRAARMCGKLVVGVINNKEKTPLFEISERVNMINEAIRGLENTEVVSFSGLQADLYRKTGADAVVRGVRNSADYDYELTMSSTNRMLLPGFETVLLFPDSRYTYVSSSTVRLLASYGADISGFVPPFIEEKIKGRFEEKYK